MSCARAKDWTEDGYMRDCVVDWRETIAEHKEAGTPNGMMWIQPWLLEALLDRLDELEKRP